MGVAFGGRSVEHDVSIITGLQALDVLSERHRPVPIYIAEADAGTPAMRCASCHDLPGRRGKQADPNAQEIHFDLHNEAAAPDCWRLLPQSAAGGQERSIELDVVVIATHGTQGEDGCLQGALELAQLAYVGPPVGAAAAAMDKVTTKALLGGGGLAAARSPGPAPGGVGERPTATA